MAISSDKEFKAALAALGTVLKASVVRIQPLDRVRMEATVSGSPNLAAGTFVVLLNRTVQVDGYTRFEDDAGGDRAFSLAKLNPNDNVEVVGSWDGTRVTATLVERIVPDDPGLVLLQGPVDPGTINLANFSFDILGIRVTSVQTFTNTEFRDALGNSVSFTTFFNSVLPGLGPDQAVKAKRGVFRISRLAFAHPGRLRHAKDGSRDRADQRLTTRRPPVQRVTYTVLSAMK